MQTELMIDIAKDHNKKVLKVMDISSYCQEPIENLLLEVIAPSSSTWKTFKQYKSFTFILNAANLGLVRVDNTQHLPALQDGIYELKLSYKPNFTTSAHFYHFNQKNITETYFDILSSLYEKRSQMLTKDFEDARRKLIEIRMDLDAAKYMVEMKHKKEEGKELYNKASEQLKKWYNECRNC